MDDIVDLKFENIGGKMICWLVNDEDFAEWLLDRLRQHAQYIGKIGYIAYQYRDLSQGLVAFLDKHFTKSWEKQCRQVWEDQGNTFMEPL